MIHSVKITGLLAIVLIVSACSKIDLFTDKEPILPSVKMIDLFTTHDTIWAVAEITDEGSGGVDLCGFFYNTKGNPGFSDHQLLFNGTDGKFAYFITNRDYDSTYYFRAIASNLAGYALSNTLSCN